MNTTNTLRFAIAGVALLASAAASMAAVSDRGGPGASGRYQNWSWKAGCTYETAFDAARAAGMSRMQMVHDGEDRYIIVGYRNGERARLVLNRETDTCKVLSFVSL